MTRTRASPSSSSWASFLIIRILLAIAIPTFRGPRERANDRSAQCNLRNALTAEKTLFTDSSAYTDTSSVTNISSLTGIEPSLTWTGVGTTYPARQVSASTSAPAGGTANSSVVVMDQSATGTCFYIGDTSGPTGTAGTFYASSTATTCVAASTLVTSLTGMTAAPTLAHADGKAAWALAF